MTRFFCVGEALSIPLLRGTWHAAQHPLPKAVLGRIVKDEAAHGTFGFTFLDWAVPQMDAAGIAHIGKHADIAIAFTRRQWVAIRAQPRKASHEGDALAWMQTDAYLELAERSLDEKVLKPLLARGIPLAEARTVAS